jgi:hypothetical protein
MHISHNRIVLTKTSTGATATLYSADAFNGLLHAITYSTGSGAAPSTAAITVEGERYGVDFLTSAAVSAASKTWFPRELAVETSGASTAALYPEHCFPLFDERVSVTLAGNTSALTTDACYLDVWVQG